MDVDSLSIFTEFSVAIAGFSGMAIAITHRGRQMSGLQRFRMLQLLNYSLAAAFVSTFPLLFEAYGATGEAVWRYTSMCGVALGVGVVAGPYAGARALADEERAQLSSIIWMLGTAGTGIVLALLIPNAVGSSSPGPIVLTLLWLIAMAALLFVRMLLSGSRG